MFELRKYQMDCVDALFEWWEENETGNPLLVLPTGAGKSVIIGEIVMRLAPYVRKILVVTHVKELIVQNRNKLPFEIDSGVYSAGLKSRDKDNLVVYAGIQSVYKRAEEFGYVDLVIIDEAHTLPQDADSMYRMFLIGLMATNPNLKVVGLTATPFRTSGVLLGKDEMFQSVAYDVRMSRLIDEGFLASLVSKSTKVQADLSNVRVVRGDYDETQMYDAHRNILVASVADLVARGADRKCWLIFASSIAHGVSIQEELLKYNIIAECVFADTENRDEILKAQQNGDLRCVINYGVLTTGYDCPRVDLIALMRSTKSAVLYTQMLGRGMRTFAGKTNCLVCDYGGNIKEHGYVDRVRLISRRTGAKEIVYEVEKSVVKICPVCDSPNHISVSQCLDCGFFFPALERIQPKADDQSDIMFVPKEPEWWDVNEVFFDRHTGKNGKRNTLRVSYYTGVKIVRQWLCFDHNQGSFPKEKADKWWEEATGGMSPPNSVEEAIESQDALYTPDRIKVQENDKGGLNVLRVLWKEGEKKKVIEPIYDEDFDIPF